MARLESDTYAIPRALSGTKELRFKQLASGPHHIYGLTDDGEVYWWLLENDTKDWKKMPMVGNV